MSIIPIRRALISVYHKEGLSSLLQELHQQGTELISTGGTLSFIASLGLPVTAVESLTHFPEILGGRVKTLHPGIFGGILARRDEADDMQQLEQHAIKPIDLVVVDLYPFQDTLAAEATEPALIEKIDIGGISLIRATAKNFYHTAIISDKKQYETVAEWIKTQHGSTTLEQRKLLAARAFQVSANYDSAIAGWLTPDPFAFQGHIWDTPNPLRYGENPHQKAVFFGRPENVFQQLHGKALSYNNLADLDAALQLISEFETPAACIIKHTNACGVATASHLTQAWELALAGDPVSAFGGIVAVNRPVTLEVAESMDSLFFELLIAPSFDNEAFDVLCKKKNRMLLTLNGAYAPARYQFKNALGGALVQEADLQLSEITSWQQVTNRKPTEAEANGLLFAEKIIRNVKSNTIVLARGNQMIGVGCGHTSRVDALRHALSKAREFGHEVPGCVMVSDAFFPFPDCVEIAAEAGISAIMQPGGSVKDQLSIDRANELGMAMVFTGIRHFKH